MNASVKNNVNASYVVFGFLLTLHATPGGREGEEGEGRDRGDGDCVGRGEGIAGSMQSVV